MLYIPLTFGFKSFFITRIWLNRWDFTKKNKKFSPGCLGWMSYTWVCKRVDTWTVLETCWVVHYIICKIELWDYYTCTSLTNNVQLQKNLGQCFSHNQSSFQYKNTHYLWLFTTHVQNSLALQIVEMFFQRYLTIFYLIFIDLRNLYNSLVLFIS